MTQIVSVINQKGGVGKSTTALALASGLKRKGKKVLAVDLDPQGSLTWCMGADPSGATALDILVNDTPARKAIQTAAQVDMIPANTDLVSTSSLMNTQGREYRLKRALQPVLADYDFIVIDTPPALGLLTVNAMTAATGLIITTQADILSLHGIGQLYETIEATRQHSNPGLKIVGILMTRHNPRTVVSRDLTKTLLEAAKRIGTKLFKTSIRECVAIKEAQVLQQDLFTYAPRSNAARDYEAFVNEFTKRI